MHRLEHRRELPFRIDVGTGCQTQTACDHDKINVARPFTGQRAPHALRQAGWSYARVLIESLTNALERIERDVVRNALRPSDRAEQDGFERTQYLQEVVRHDSSGLGPVL